MVPPSGRNCDRFVLMADDLTGAADTAVALAGVGREAEILLKPCMSLRTYGRVVAIDLDTRRMTEPEAVRTVREFSVSLPSSDIQLFKKIDSTLRGHIGAELAALYQSITLPIQQEGRLPTLCLVAPAHPQLGRALKNGRLVHRNDRRPGSTSQSEKLDTDSPSIMTELALHGFSCELLSTSFIRTSDRLQAHMEAVASRPMPAMICDAETTDDLERIAAAALAAAINCIWVGSAGLAYALNRKLPSTHKGAAHQPGPFMAAGAGSRLFLVGSYSCVARQQVHELLRTDQLQCVAISPHASLGQPDQQAQRQIDEIIATGKDLVICIAPEGEFQAGHSLELANRMAALVAPRLGRLGALVCCGGDTSRALFDNLRLHRLLGRQSHIPGASHIRTEAYPKLPIIIKAGAFGDARSLLRIREHLATHAS